MLLFKEKHSAFSPWKKFQVSYVSTMNGLPTFNLLVDSNKWNPITRFSPFCRSSFKITSTPNSRKTQSLNPKLGKVSQLRLASERKSFLSNTWRQISSCSQHMMAAMRWLPGRNVLFGSTSYTSLNNSGEQKPQSPAMVATGSPPSHPWHLGH